MTAVEGAAAGNKKKAWSSAASCKSARATSSFMARSVMPVVVGGGG